MRPMIYHVKFLNTRPERIHADHWQELIEILSRMVERHGPVEWLIRD